MIDKESEINRELGKHTDEPNELTKQINSILAYGSANLGLNNFSWKDNSEERLKEDLKK